jgi:hypothetical protein
MRLETLACLITCYVTLSSAIYKPAWYTWGIFWFMWGLTLVWVIVAYRIKVWIWKDEPTEEVENV